MTEAHRADGGARSGIAGGHASATAYDRIGGESAVAGLVEQFFDLVMVDERLRLFFLDRDGLFDRDGGPNDETSPDLPSAGPPRDGSHHRAASRQGFPDPPALASIRGHFATLVATMLGARLRYEGRNIAEAHRGLNVTADDYDRMCDLFVATLRLNEVPEDIVDVVVEKFAALKPIIVEIGRPAYVG